MPDSSHECTLLTLPGEVRNRICVQVLRVSEPVDVDPHRPNRDILAKINSLFKRQDMYGLHILRTCHQIRGEATPIFYSFNVFRLYCPTDIESLPKYLGLANIASIKHIRVCQYINYGSHDYLPVWSRTFRYLAAMAPNLQALLFIALGCELDTNKLRFMRFAKAVLEVFPKLTKVVQCDTVAEDAILGIEGIQLLFVPDRYKLAGETVSVLPTPSKNHFIDKSSRSQSSTSSAKSQV